MTCTSKTKNEKRQNEKRKNQIPKGNPKGKRKRKNVYKN